MTDDTITKPTYEPEQQQGEVGALMVGKGARLLVAQHGRTKTAEMLIDLAEMIANDRDLVREHV